MRFRPVLTNHVGLVVRFSVMFLLAVTTDWFPALAGCPMTFEQCIGADTGPSSPVTGFSAYGGTWRVEEDVLHASAGSGPKLVADVPEVTAGSVGVEVLLPDQASGNAGLILKVSDCAEGADKFNGYEISFNGAGYLTFGRHCQNWRHIRDVPMEVPLNRWRALGVTFTETTLRVSVDGQQVLDYEDTEAPLRRGRIGLRPWQRNACFRNLWYDTDGKRISIPFLQARDTDRDDLEEVLKKADVPPFAVVLRHPLSRPNAVSCDIWQSKPRQPGCAIRIVDSARPADAKTIFEDPAGCIYDMNISPDAKTLLFSYWRKEDERHWHIWRIGTDGTGLQQLTDGPYYDISPCFLPDGRIAFVSTRLPGFTVCQPGPRSDLHTMAADGSDIRCISMNTLADFSPQMLPDGRLLFTRWEYVDRDLTYRQSLWTENPDGSGYQLYFGNTIRDVGTFWQARPIGGRTDLVAATFAPHHGFPHGAIGIINTEYGVEGPRGIGFGWVTHEFQQIGDRAHEWSYRDPFPLDGSLMLCSYGGGGVNRYRIVLLAAWDRTRPLYDDPELNCFCPLPIRTTSTAPILTSRSAPSGDGMSTFVLADVYRGLTGIERGRVKALRIMEQIPKSEDLVKRAYDQSPIMSYGTYYAKRTWGTVPVYEDGSAYFRAPALREIYFQALDAEGRELQRMTSAVQAMPGETVGCIGCHEPRRMAPPPTGIPKALSYPPHEPRPAACAQDGIIDFQTVVQPILDRHCVRCHSGPDPRGGMLLTGDRTRLFSMAYDNLLGRSRSYRQHNMTTGDMLPEEQAKGMPLVHFYWLLRTPTAVNRPLQTGSLASRLLQYIETDHSGSVLSPEERARIYAWIDADVPYYRTYAHSRPRSPGRRDLCTDPATGAECEWFVKGFRGVYDKHCVSCHGPVPDPNNHKEIWDGRLAWIDFTRPEWSPALTAHLAKPYGRGITTPKDGVDPPVFHDMSDPDWQTMLKAIQEGKALMLAVPRADMPGFAVKRAP